MSPTGQELQWAMIAPLHSSLGETEEDTLLIKKRKKIHSFIPYSSQNTEYIILYIVISSQKCPT